MAQHREDYFVIPMLKVLFFHNEPISTEEIKKEICKHCELSEEDLSPYPSRSKKEPRYYQIVGNIISHNNPNFFKYINRIKSLDTNGKKGSPDLFSLNEEGYKYISNIIENDEEVIDGFYVIDDIINNDKTISDYDLGESNKKTIELFNKSGEVKKPASDKSLAKVVLEMTGYECQIASLLGEEHELFKNKNGEPYLEMHHLIPLKASKDFFPINLDIAPNLVPLCPSCHAKLHHGSEEEKTIILELLYSKRIKSLNENGIYISFNDLIKKYYI